jgi:uncharacterized lipoprotein
MSYSLQKSALAKVVGVSLVLLLSACSSDQHYKSEVNGDESYLQATPLSGLNAPSGITLPAANGAYTVPAGSMTGSIGKQLDIRPPAQSAALASSANSQSSGDSAAVASRASGEKTGRIVVESGIDDSGFALLMIRADYAQVWKQLPSALANIGMKVTDSRANQGSLAVTYKPLSREGWESLAVHNPRLPAGNYKLQLGDLSHRSSLQFLDAKGHVLSQSQNDALVAVLQAALNQGSVK